MILNVSGPPSRDFDSLDAEVNQARKAKGQRD